MNTDLYGHCQLCPRDCGVDRIRGRMGVCGETAELRISHIGPHTGEEPSFSGTRGSGTIFFCGCSSPCFFCQNHQISTNHRGTVYSAEQFFREVKTLIESKVHNLNFVTPDHFWPHIKELCFRLREEEILIPKLFNSSGYQKEALIPEYADFMDIFLPDMKFADGALAKLCMNDENYPGIAMAAIRRMVRLKGFLDLWDPEGNQTARRGVLVRHLVLPGHVENSLKVLDLLYGEFGPGIPISVMSQFCPVPACSRMRLMTRGLLPEEYGRVLEHIDKLGFEKVYTQVLSEKTEYLPDFNDPDDPFPGHRKKA